jgi:hypothetical protein
MKAPFVHQMVERFGELPTRAILSSIDDGEFPDYAFIPKDVLSKFKEDFAYTGNWEAASDRFLKSFTLRQSKWNDGMTNDAASLFRHNMFFPLNKVVNLAKERLNLSLLESIAMDLYSKTGMILKIVAGQEDKAPMNKIGNRNFEVNWEHFRTAENLSQFNLLFFPLLESVNPMAVLRMLDTYFGVDGEVNYEELFTFLAKKNPTAVEQKMIDKFNKDLLNVAKVTPIEGQPYFDTIMGIMHSIQKADKAATVNQVSENVYPPSYNGIRTIGKIEKINGLKSFLESKGWKIDPMITSMRGSVLSLLNLNSEKFKEQITPIRTAMWKVPEMTQLVNNYREQFGKEADFDAIVHAMNLGNKGYRTGTKLDGLLQGLQESYLSELKNSIGENVTIDPHATLEEVYELAAAINPEVNRSHETAHEAVLQAEIKMAENQEEYDLEDDLHVRTNENPSHTSGVLLNDYNNYTQFRDDLNALRMGEPIEFTDGDLSLSDKYPGLVPVLKAYMPYVKSLEVITANEQEELFDYVAREYSLLKDMEDGHMNNGSMLVDMKDLFIAQEENDLLETEQKEQAMEDIRTGNIKGEYPYQVGDTEYKFGFSMKNRVMEITLKPTIAEIKLSSSMLQNILEDMVAKLKSLYDFSAIKVGPWIKRISEIKDIAKTPNLFFGSQTFQQSGNSIIIPAHETWNAESTTNEVTSDTIDHGRPSASTKARTKAYASRVAARFGLNVTFVNRPGEDWSGHWNAETKTVEINLANVQDNTAVHEVLHPIVDVLEQQNEGLYNQFKEMAIELGYWAKAETDGLNLNTDKEAIVMMLTDQAQGKIKEQSTALGEMITQFFEWLKSVLSDVFKQELDMSQLSLNTSMAEFMYKLFDTNTRMSLPEDYEEFGESGYQRTNVNLLRFLNPKLLQEQREAEQLFYPDANSEVTIEQVYDLMKIGKASIKDQVKTIYSKVDGEKIYFTDEEIEAMIPEELFWRVKNNDGPLKKYGYVMVESATDKDDSGNPRMFKRVADFYPENLAEFAELLRNTQGIEALNEQAVAGSSYSEMDGAFVEYMNNRDDMTEIWEIIGLGNMEDLSPENLAKLAFRVSKLPDIMKISLMEGIDKRIQALQMVQNMKDEHRSQNTNQIKWTHIYLFRASQPDRSMINEFNKSKMFLGILGPTFASKFMLDRNMDDSHLLIQALHSNVLEAHRMNSAQSDEIKRILEIAKDKGAKISNITYSNKSGRFFMHDHELLRDSKSGKITEIERDLGYYINNQYFNKHSRFQGKGRTEKAIRVPISYANRNEFMKKFGIMAGRSLYFLAKPSRLDGISIMVKGGEDSVLRDVLIKASKSYGPSLAVGLDQTFTLGELKKMINPSTATIDETIAALKEAKRMTKKMSKQNSDAIGQRVNKAKRGENITGFGQDIAEIYRSGDDYAATKSNMVRMVHAHNLNNVLPFTRFVLSQYKTKIGKETSPINIYLSHYADERIYNCYKDELDDHKSVLNKLLGYVALSTLGLNAKAQLMNLMIGTASNFMYNPGILGRSFLTLSGTLVKDPKEALKYFKVMKSLNIGTLKSDMEDGSSFGKIGDFANTTMFWLTERAEQINQMQLFAGMVTKEEMDQYNNDGTLKINPATGEQYSGIVGDRYKHISWIIRQVHGDYGYNRPEWSYTFWGKLFGMFRWSWQQTILVNHFGKRMTDSAGNIQVGSMHSLGVGIAAFTYQKILSPAGRKSFLGKVKNIDAFNEVRRVIEESSIDANGNKVEGAKIDWSNLSERDKANMWFALREALLILALFAIRTGIGGDMDELLTDPLTGKKIRKSKLSKEYIRKYETEVIWKKKLDQLILDLAFPIIPVSRIGMQQTAKAPAPINYIERWFTLGQQVYSGAEYQYSTEYGAAGEWKGWNTAIKLLPGGALASQIRMFHRRTSGSIQKERDIKAKLKKSGQAENKTSRFR